MIKNGIIIILICIIAVSPYLMPAKVYAESPFDGIAMFILQRIDDVDKLLEVFDILKWGTKNRDEEANKNAKDFEKKLIEEDAIDCLSQDVFKYCYMDHPNICKQEGIENKEDWMELPENVRLEIIKNNGYFQLGRQAWNEGLDGFGVVHDGIFTDPLKNRSPAEKLFFERCPPKSGSKSLKTNPRAMVSKIDPVNTVKPITATIAKPKIKQSMRISGATCQGRQFSFMPPEGYRVKEIPSECFTVDNKIKSSKYYELTKEDEQGNHRILVNIYTTGESHGDNLEEKVEVDGYSASLMISKIDQPLSPDDIERDRSIKDTPEYTTMPEFDKKLIDQNITTGRLKVLGADLYLSEESKQRLGDLLSADFPFFILTSTSLDEGALMDFRNMLKTVDFALKN